jgi:hypothetical protein
MYESQNTKVGAAAFKARVVEKLASASASGIDRGRFEPAG